MPKLPVASGTDVVQALHCQGVAVVRQQGSHIVMRRGSSGCVVPNYQKLKVGILMGLLKQAGISQDEFMEAHNA